MNKWLQNIILLLFTFWSLIVHSQKNCTVPLSPQLTSVSVLPSTGNTELHWKPSESTGIAAYVIYSYKNGNGTPVDTIWNPFATSRVLSTPASKYFSVSYVVAAHRMPDCTSPLSNSINTIFCSSESDTCNKKLIIKWNSYPDFPVNVLEYEILVLVNGNPITHSYRVNKNTTSLTVTDFITDSQYCFEVRALLEDGSVSSSNRSCLSTKMQRPPDWINSDYATVENDNSISLSYTLDPMSEIHHFRLERKSRDSENFQEIAQINSTAGSFLFNDKQADSKIQNIYRLSALNSCKIPVTYSNLATNIVLTIERRSDEIYLSWNSYKEWAGKVESYKLFINTGDGFKEKVTLQPSDTVFSLYYQEIMYDVTGSEVCFYISASEKSNPHNVSGASNSLIVCIVPSEIITVPNVFTPDNDLLNDYFRPVLSFTPNDYYLVISDRHGKILFETRDYLEEWDGRQNGDNPPQEVCLWFLKIITPSGNTISKTGTVTIIRGR